MKTNFERIFTTDITKYTVVLLFGNCLSSLQRALYYVQSNYPDLKPLSESQFLESDGQPESMSLFPELDERVPLIQEVTDKSYKKLLESPLTQRTIFLSSKLRTTSNFVKFAQADPQTLAVGCYETPLLRAEIEFYLSDSRMDPKLKSKILETFSTDPELFYNFLKIYDLMKSSECELLLGQVLNQHQTSAQQDSFTNPFLTPNTSRIAKEFSPHNDSKLQNARSCGRVLQLLYSLKAFNYDKARLSPPLFFKDEPVYLAAARKYSFSHLKRALESTMDLEDKIKRVDNKSYDYQMFHMEHLS